jgi:hypothetical protein
MLAWLEKSKKELDLCQKCGNAPVDWLVTGEKERLCTSCWKEWMRG